MPKYRAVGKMAHSRDDFIVALNPPKKVEQKVRFLVTQAFDAYAAFWDCHDYHHKEYWKWPRNELATEGKFVGDEPWTVMLREAAKLSGALKTKVRSS